jgi:hypothetical protein
MVKTSCSAPHHCNGRQRGFVLESAAHFAVVFGGRWVKIFSE